MNLITLPDGKKKSYHRKSSQHALWKVKLNEAKRLPFSLLSGREVGDVKELRTVFSFFFNRVDVPRKDFLSWFTSHLPMMAWRGDSRPGALSVFFLAKAFFKESEVTLLEETRQFLAGSREIKMIKFSHLDFSLNSPDHFVGGEIKFLVETERGKRRVEKSLPLFRETCLKAFRSCKSAMTSSKKERDDFKLARIKADLSFIGSRFPHLFDASLLDAFSFFFACAKKKFIHERSAPFLRRIVLSLEYVRQRLSENLKGDQDKKRLTLRAFPLRDRAFAVTVAAHLSKYHYLSEEQIVLAAQKGIPESRVIPHSFCSFTPQHDSIQTFYLELKKEKSAPFSQKERTFLRCAFLEEIAKRIERLSLSAFGVCLEEEVMKHAAILLREVVSTPLLPHMMILFDHLEGEALFFTLLLVRMKPKNGRALETLFKKGDKTVVCIPDRVSLIGEYEVNICRIQMTKTVDIVRSNGAIHVGLARKKIAALLEKELGEIRDYNGGLLEKKEANVAALKGAFKEVEPELVETFLYSLFPVAEQATLSLEELSTFFRFFLSHLSRPQEITIDEREEALFAHIANCGECTTFLKKEGFFHTFPSLIFASLEVSGIYHLSFFLADPSLKTKELFKKALERSYAKWKRRETCLRISLMVTSPLDPRRGGDRNVTILLRALFEGLTRFDGKGKLILSLAKSFAVSSDQKNYTFSLRKTRWSNKDPVTAYDFEYAWKTALSPSFSVDFPELFYCIQGAEEAKRGKIPLDQVGIRAENDHTLSIALEYRAPDFLERLAHTLFLPIPSKVAKKDPYWMKREGKAFVSNGPFCLAKREVGDLFTLKKNSDYYDKKRVKIDKISSVQALTRISHKPLGKLGTSVPPNIPSNSFGNVFKHSLQELLEISKKQSVQSSSRAGEKYGLTHEGIPLFRKKALDFFEVPSAAVGDLARKESEIGSISLPAPHVTWFAINTTSFPLSHLHFRLALALSLNREKLKDLFPCEKTTALTPLPRHLTEHEHAPFLMHYNPSKAKTYLASALLDLGLTKETMPPISLMVPESELSARLAKGLKEEWEKVLGISCMIESYPWGEFYERRITKRFQLAFVEWGIPTSDPLSTLSAFKTRHDKLNLSAWESPEYQKLLEKAQRETHPIKRNKLISKLEKMLILQVPILPLFYGRYWFFKRRELNISPITPTFNGMPDFSHFSFKDEVT